MNQFTRPDLTVLTIEDEAPEEIFRDAEACCKAYLRRPLFSKLAEVYGSRCGLSGTVLVKAHGKMINNHWCFGEDTSLLMRVQESLISRLDGTCRLIILNICNPKGVTIQSERSIVIHPPDTISFFQLIQGKGHPRMYVPGFGYVEDKLRHVIKTLQSPSA